MKITSKADRDRVRQRSAAKRKAATWKPKSDLSHIDIENPDFDRSRGVSNSNPEIVSAVINRRESAIVTLFSRKLITDDQYKAAQRFLSHYEALGGAGARAMDYSREVVDCRSGGGNAFSDRHLTAMHEMQKCSKLLGVLGFELVCRIVGQGRSIQDLAGKERRKRDYITDHLRECLDVLSVNWGYASAKIRNWHS